MNVKLSILLVFTALFVGAQASASSGSMDLRTLTFGEDEIISLEDEWEMYPSMLLKPDDFQKLSARPLYVDINKNWSDIPELNTGFHEFGFATYRLRLIMPGELPPASIVLREINTAYEIYLNGELVESGGRVGDSPETARPGWRQKIKNLEFLPGENELVMLVSNFDHHFGGPRKPVLLGSEERLSFLKNFGTGSLLFLTGCLAIGGVFALGLFWFKPGDTSSLLFMLFCFSYAYWVLSSDFHFIYSFFDNMAWGVAVRLQYAALSLAVISYAYFIKRMAEPLINPWLFHSVAGFSAVLLLMTTFTPVPFFTMLLPYYYLLVITGFVLILTISLVRFNFGHKLAWVNIVGLAVLSFIIGHKLVSMYGWVTENPLVNIIGSVVFIFTQALALAIRFGRNYREFSMAAMAATRTRDEFLNTMSHELKTPMNAILGMTAFLEKSDLTRQQKDKLSAIKSNGETLLSLITDVLSISEVGTGKLHLKNQPVNIESCVESAIGLSSQHRNRDKVEFRLNMAPDIPALLRGDSSRIKQILMHLLSNAFKYTEEGEVQLRVRLLNQTREHTEIGFVVQDTGVGISENQRARVFEKFKQAQFGNTRRYGGAGLGLSVVNELVGKMGGALKLESSKAGTRIGFSLKLQNQAQQPVREVTSIFARNEVDTSLKLLYAEDNPVNQKLLEMMLGAMGLKVDMARNGQEAVEMARKQYYNIIFMDIQMPVMDGLEATERIVEECVSRPIIVAVTANLAEVDKRKCFDAGMNDFLNKPIQQDELKLAVIKWQGLKKYLDDSGEDTIKLSS